MNDEQRITVLKETISALESQIEPLRTLLKHQQETIQSCQDLIAVLNKASQDWLDGEPRRLAELADLKAQIALLDTQPRSSRNDA